ncbi:MAG: biotin--[acetyl-CoA-carboxylase] ligase, partial [Burkholderiaceae bacterium]
PQARPWLQGAHLQERGRGRAGRRWQNRPGANLMFSCAFDVFLAPQQLPTLSPLAGLAACEALRELVEPEHRSRMTMKWPNDLQWDSAKLAGILVEVTRSGASRLSPDHYVVIIGIGLNLDDARSLSLSLNRRVADWSEIARQDAKAAAVSAAGLVGQIAQAWYASLNQATAYGFDSLPARYAQVDSLAGQHINVLDDGRIAQAGIACGINHYGQLLLRTPQGEQAISVGEVSVRPLQEHAS